MPRHLLFLPQGALAWSPAADSGRHSHRAVQLLIALAQPFSLETEGAAADCHWAVLAPQQAHRVRGSGQPIVHLFIDPGPAAWWRWQRSAGAPRPPDAALIARLRKGWDCPPTQAEAIELLQGWRQQCLPGLLDAAPSDPRIAAAVALIDQDPSAPGLGHRDLAARVHLSPSRFLALFPQHSGMPVRHYVLWRRLLRAVDLLDRGQSVTDAAHSAGFADAAHLSRSFRKIIGASPSEVRLPGLRSRPGQ